MSTPTGIPPAEAFSAAGEERLPRRLGGWSAAAVVIGVMIGSGIFRVPASVAAEAGGVPAIFALWLLGGLVALCGALSLAELATMFPRPGGEYVFLRETYGRLLAFLFGWTVLLVNPAAWAAIALIFAAYLGTFVALSETATRAVAAGVILLVSACSYRSVRLGAAIQSASTLAKVLALFGVAAAVFLFGGRGAEPAAGTAGVPGGGWGGMGIAFIGVLFAYEGWTAVISLAGEVRDPSRNLPRALIGGVAVVMLVYLVVNAAYLYALPIHVMAGSSLVAADAMARAVGAGAAAVIAALVMLSTFGSLNGSLLADPRYFFAMADDGVFFRSLAAVHPRFRTPHRAIAFSAALALLYVSVRTFEQLAEAFVVGLWPFLVLNVAAVIVLRWRRPGLPRPYHTPWYPWVPLAFIAVGSGMLLNALAQRPTTTLLSIAITLAGVPVFVVWQALRRAGS